MSSSLNDQSEDSIPPQREQVLDQKSIFAAALLLVIPAGIPLFFATQVDAKNVGMLVGLGLVVLVLNALLLVVLVRWFRQLREA